jgi:hypothetical protein
MIRIRIELIPGGDETRARELARAEIANIDAMERFSHSDYAITASECDNKWAGTKAWERRGNLFEQPRRASIWKLCGALAEWALAESEKP